MPCVYLQGFFFYLSSESWQQNNESVTNLHCYVYVNVHVPLGGRGNRQNLCVCVCVCVSGVVVGVGQVGQAHPAP